MLFIARERINITTSREGFTCFLDESLQLCILLINDGRLFISVGVFRATGKYRSLEFLRKRLEILIHSLTSVQPHCGDSELIGCVSLVFFYDMFYI